MTVLNTNKVDFTKQPMFFGEPLGLQRYDDFKYPIFEKLTERQLSYFWRPQEITLQKDRNDYLQLRPEHKFIFTTNLKYQTMLDSVQGRAPNRVLGDICSLPELEGCISAWTFMEGIHSRSYTYLIKNFYPVSSDIFDSVLEDKNILERAKSVTSAYDILANSKGANRKRDLYRALVSVNILEGIRFYVSFACTFAFGEMKLMEGTAKILSLIARDEFQHLAITQNIINLYRTEENDKEMKQVIKDNEEWAIQAFKDAVQEEKNWAKYLFSQGSMIGLSENLLCDYVEFIANKRMKTIGLEPVFPKRATNPLPWLDKNWLNTRNVQVAPQETESINYMVGGTKRDIESSTFKGFKL